MLSCRHEVGCLFPFGVQSYSARTRIFSPMALEDSFVPLFESPTKPPCDSQVGRFADTEVLQTGWLKWQHFFSHDAKATGQGVSGVGFCSECSVSSLATPVSSCGLPLVWVDRFSSYQGTGHIGLYLCSHFSLTVSFNALTRNTLIFRGTRGWDFTTGILWQQSWPHYTKHNVASHWWWGG